MATKAIVPKRSNNQDYQVRTKRINPEIPNPIHMEDWGTRYSGEVQPPEVDLARLEVKPKVAHQPFQVGDGTLELTRRTHVQGVSIEPGDLGLKWLDKLLVGSIRSFYQLFESFVAWFVINTKAVKCVSSLLTPLHKGKNEFSANVKKLLGALQLNWGMLIRAHRDQLHPRTNPGREAMGRPGAQPSNRSPRSHVLDGDVCSIGG